MCVYIFIYIYIYKYIYIYIYIYIYMLHCSLLCTSAYKLKVNKSFQYIYIRVTIPAT